MTDNDQHKMLMEIHSTVNEVRTLLVGDSFGRGGIIERVEDLEKSDKKQNEFLFKAIGAIGILSIIIPIAMHIFWK